MLFSSVLKLKPYLVKERYTLVTFFLFPLAIRTEHNLKPLPHPLSLPTYKQQKNTVTPVPQRSLRYYWLHQLDIKTCYLFKYITHIPIMNYVSHPVISVVSYFPLPLKLHVGCWSAPPNDGHPPPTGCRSGPSCQC